MPAANQVARRIAGSQRLVAARAAHEPPGHQGVQVRVAPRLQVHALACNLGNFMRTLVLPDAVEQCSLTTLREKRVKIGAKIVRHGRCIVFRMAEIAVPRNLFADILRRIDRLGTTPLPTGRQDRPSCEKTTGPACPRHGPTGDIECRHVPLTLDFVVSGMIMVAEPIGLALRAVSSHARLG